jgi:hypothetical protein
MPQKLAFYSLILCVTRLNLYKLIGGGKYSASTLDLEIFWLELRFSGILHESKSLKDHSLEDFEFSGPESILFKFVRISDAF